jgi:putative transposase
MPRNRCSRSPEIPAHDAVKSVLTITRNAQVNHKKIRRLMREHDLQPRLRRRFVATTDSDHDGPVFPNRADRVLDGPDQLWVADIT